MFQRGSLIKIEDFDFTLINPSLNSLTRFRDKFIIILENKNDEVFCCFTTTYRNEQLLNQHSVIGCNPHVIQFKVFKFDNSIQTCSDTSFKFHAPTYIGGVKGQFFEIPLPTIYQNFHHHQMNLINKIGQVDDFILVDMLICLHESQKLESDYRDKLYQIGDEIYTEIQKAKEANN